MLEEPEHLNWFNSGGLWTDTFPHVVGIAHTNYVEYARQDRGELNARFLKNINKLMVALHCHKVIKLSDAVQPLPKQVCYFPSGRPNKRNPPSRMPVGGGGVPSSPLSLCLYLFVCISNAKSLEFVVS